MQHLELLQLDFETKIDPREISGFRAAVLDYMGWGYDGLPSLEERNHKRTVRPGNVAGLPVYSFGYPLAQFKMCRCHDSYHPMLLYLGPNPGKIEALFHSARHASVLTNGQAYPLRISRARTESFHLQAGKDWVDYHLFRYQGLTAADYRDFQLLTGAEERLSFLQRLLTKHLRSFARGVGWQVGIPIEVAHLHILREGPLSFPGTRYPCFDLSFRCNLFLPEHLGLGNAVVLGLGTLRLDRRGQN